MKSIIQRAKAFMSSSFNMKDMGELRYFLGIEVDKHQDGIFLSQKKYTLDLLADYNMKNYKPLKLPMNSHLKLTAEIGDALTNPTEYQTLVAK